MVQNLLAQKKRDRLLLVTNSKGRIRGIGNVGMTPNPAIEHVLFVDGLMHNWLSINLLYVKGNLVLFESYICIVENIESKKVSFAGHQQENVYIVHLENISSKNVKCIFSLSDKDSWQWHRRLAHTSMNLISKLAKKNLV